MYKPELTKDEDYTYCLRQRLPVTILDACTGKIIDKGFVESFDSYSFSVNGIPYERNQWKNRVYVAYS